MKQDIPFDHHGISGGISVKIRDNQTLDNFCMLHIHDYDPDRFEAIAIRLFSGKETIVTIYALDKSYQENRNYNPDKLPVRKFKIQHISSETLFVFFEEFNFTLSTGNYELDDMEVINE